MRIMIVARRFLTKKMAERDVDLAISAG